MWMREHVLSGAVGSHLMIMRVAGFRIKLVIQKAEWKDGKKQLLVTKDLNNP